MAVLPMHLSMEDVSRMDTFQEAFPIERQRIGVIVGSNGALGHGVAERSNNAGCGLFPSEKIEASNTTDVYYIYFTSNGKSSPSALSLRVFLPRPIRRIPATLSWSRLETSLSRWNFQRARLIVGRRDRWDRAVAQLRSLIGVAALIIADGTYRG